MLTEEAEGHRTKMRSKLPSNVRALMDRLEEFAAVHIAVLPNTEPISPSDPFPQAPAALITHDKAAIFLRDMDAINPHGVLHELLHIERYWIEGVAQIRPLADDKAENNRAITAEIENVLEHLAIVPKEAEYGFEPYGHWNDITSKHCDMYPWPHLVSKGGRRRSCLLGGLTAALVTDGAVAERHQNCLAQEGLLFESRKLIENVRPLMAAPKDKPHALACTARFLKIPPDAVRLVYFDVKSKSRRSESMPRS